MISNSSNAGRAPTNPAAAAAAALGNGRRQVRVNALRVLGEILERAPWQLAWLTYQLFECVATIIILGVVWNSEYCNQQPLRPWILLYSGRLVFRIPLSIFFINHARMRQQSVPAWISLLDALLLVYLIFIWFLGNLWFYSSSVCRLTAPVSYYYAVTLISLVYFCFAIPLLLCLGTCFCFPLLLLCLHACGIGEKGATNRMIAKLPHRIFDGHPIARPDGTVDESGTQCAICMNDFQVGDDIVTLPCGHSFNKECAERWLRLKRICALCRHDITQPGNF